MVGHTKLEPTRCSGCIGIGCCIGVTVDALDHHWNGRTVAWIVVELFNGRSRVIKDDVRIAGNACRSQGDVSTGAFTQHGNLGVINAISIVGFGDVLAEETNRCAAVLHTAVCRLNELQRAL